MIKFLLWCILLVLCWPLALLALVLYPLSGFCCCRFAWWGLRWAARWSWWAPLFCCR